MRGPRFLFGVAAIAVGIVALPLSAGAVIPAASTFTTKNLTAIGFSANPVPTDNTVVGQGVFNSDLAFWGDLAVQGTYDGFRLINIADPANPTLIKDYDGCVAGTGTGNQGDVIIWGNLVFRSWNSPTPAPLDPLDTTPPISSIPTTDPRRYTIPGATCGNWPMFREPAVPAGCTPSSACTLPERGQEGVHVFDISNPANPVVVAFVDAPCGSHTATGVPDLANNRFLIYNSPSAGTIFGTPTPGEEPLHCQGVDIMQVPLANPAASSYLRFLSSNPEADLDDRHSCHDTGVILGDVLKMACAGGDSTSIFSMDPADGGSLDNPKFMHHVEFPGVGIGHSAIFSPDGKYVVFGHEPGGGSQAQCQATSSVTNRSLFFVDVEAGATVGTFVHPRPQTNLENCTWHNYNTIPTNKGYFFVAGNYQAGISVVDFTDPTNAREIAFADPSTLADPNPPTGIELGGDWGSYYYNGYIYESDITRGLLVWDRESEADLTARQAAESAAFAAAQKTASDAFNAQQAAAKAAFLAALAVRDAACRALADPAARQTCRQGLNAERTAFDLAQKTAAEAFRTQQRADAGVLLEKQKATREDWRTVGLALKSAKPLQHLNPQTHETSIPLQAG